MWFWGFMIAAGVLLLAGAVVEGFFWWSVTGFGVLWAVAIVVEVLWNWREERALSGGPQDETLRKAAVAIPSPRTPQGKE